MKHWICASLMSLSFVSSAYAWSWQDLWLTRNQQAYRLMQKNQFTKAQKTFADSAWQATAAFRAKDYTRASETYAKLKTADGYYNQGNALAQLGQYEAALKAYDQSLALRPKDQDTRDNRAIVESLLKKEEKPQDQKPQDQKPQDQKPQDQKPKDQKPKDQKPQDQPQKTKSQREQQANEQLLKMIPDDPGGLLRQKFLRDHLRRMEQEDS
jgi:Ca-activated chloride channel family protein